MFTSSVLLNIGLPPVPKTHLPITGHDGRQPKGREGEKCKIFCIYEIIIQFGKLWILYNGIHPLMFRVEGGYPS